MNVFEYVINYPFVRYALIVGVLISLCSALLGVTLVLKRYSYIGDGLSHVAFGAMAIAATLNFTNDLMVVMPVTVVVAMLLLGMGNNQKIKGDSAIAMISVATLALGYLILNKFPPTTSNGNLSGDVCTSLFGSTAILTLTKSDLWLCLIMSIIVLTVFVVFYNRIFAVTFDDTFARATGVRARLYNIMLSVITAIVISISMRLVGSLLVSALIVFPAMASMRVFKSFLSVTVSSAVISVVCAILGILLSIGLDTPVGSTIVASDALFFIAFAIAGSVISKVKQR